ncbi:MAG: hypothetical protein WD205_00370 [Rhodothermales bacterium]
MALSANTPRTYQVGDKEDYPVAASAQVYEGAAVGENASGYARPLTAGDPFLGLAEFEADNSAGSAGDIRVRVKKKGNVLLAVTGASAITANDRPAVYASDDGTFTLTSTSNSFVGYVSRWISGTNCIVEFDAAWPAPA